MRRKVRKKSLVFLVTIMLAASVFSGVVAAISNRAPDVAKEKAKEPRLEKIEFIHWKKGFVKPPCDNNGACDPGENSSCADCKKEGDDETITTCYTLMGQYGKRLLQWKELPVDYVVNPTNSDGLRENFVTQAISAGSEEWDANTETELFNNTYEINKTVAYGVQDYINTIAWGDYPTTGVIGVTTVWYNPATKTIVEFDVMFDTDYAWGDATIDAAVMDLQNIATHELGHGAGLDDVYETECSVVTMYGYSKEGEIDKRSLESPDITGIQELYGG